MHNFQQIEKDAPLSFLLFQEYFMDKYASYAAAILPNFDLAIGNLKIPFQSSILYEFFDSLGLFITSENTDDGEFLYVFSRFEDYKNEIILGTHLTMPEKSSDNHIYFDSRKEMEVEAFKYAFEHLNTLLQNGVKFLDINEIIIPTEHIKENYEKTKVAAQAKESL